VTYVDSAIFNLSVALTPNSDDGVLVLDPGRVPDVVRLHRAGARVVRPGHVRVHRALAAGHAAATGAAATSPSRVRWAAL
jgi:hypothetical protein